MELAFAALHQVLAPMLDRLPGPQRDALGTAFGVRAGEAPDRFVVGLATLGLLSEVAEEQPLLCLLDDAQWLDRASTQALAFVARRLRTESVGRRPAKRNRGSWTIRIPSLTLRAVRTRRRLVLRAASSVGGRPGSARSRRRRVSGLLAIQRSSLASSVAVSQVA
jgi:hypothetical protein